MKDHVRILLLGDDGVGKSSLISTYISRHFPSSVPPIIADATIPAESTADEVAVTIVDSSSKHSERDSLRKKIVSADSIIALYDVTRPETLESVSQVWLPLIEELSSGSKKPVLVLGTKIDLLDADEDMEKLQMIIEQFPFVVLASKCSAVKLDVDRVFHLGASLVSHPLFPIFDMNSKDLTPTSRSAFLRVFRIFDEDGDNLWSDEELFCIQSKCFITPITAREVPAIKRQIHLTTPGGIVNNRLTFEGFLALMKMSIYGAMGVVPWTILRKYNYNDELVLQIPKEVQTVGKLKEEDVWELSDGARAFLLSLAKNAYTENAKPIKPDSDSEVDDCLTWEALRSIWSTLTYEESIPWSQPPYYKTSLSLVGTQGSAVPQLILLTGLPHSGANFTFDHWMSHWDSLTMSDPSLTQILLYKLGYVDRADYGLVASGGSLVKLTSDYKALHAPKSLLSYLLSPFSPSPPQIPRPRQTMRVCVLGGDGVGKSSFVWHLSDLSPPGATDVYDLEKALSVQKAYDTIVIGGYRLSLEISKEGVGSQLGQGSQGGVVNNPLGLVIAAIPMDHVQKWMKRSIQSCDCVVLMFQCGDKESLQTVFKLEALLPAHIPRFYIANKADMIDSNVMQNKEASAKLLSQHEEALEKASLHIKAEDLPTLTCTSTLTGQGMSDVVQTIRNIATNPRIAQPRETKAKPQASLFTSSVPPLVYLTAAISMVGISAAIILHYNKEVKGWFRSMLSTTKGLFTK